jgi:hypothetical protein
MSTVGTFDSPDNTVVITDSRNFEKTSVASVRQMAKGKFDRSFKAGDTEREDGIMSPERLSIQIRNELFE